WRGGRLWLVDAGARTLIRLTGDESPEIVCNLDGIPAGLGFLQNGDPVVTDMHGRSLVQCAVGRPSQYTDLSSITGTIDDMTIVDRISVPGRRGVACVLGGADRRTLFCISMEQKQIVPTDRKPRSFLDAAVVEVPGEGYP